MADVKVKNAFTTYSAQGNREDLSDKIYNIDPFDTPVVSMAARRTVKNRQFDWQTENLPVVDLANARVEGFELDRRAPTPTIRRSNVTQISSRDAPTLAASRGDTVMPGIISRQFTGCVAGNRHAKGGRGWLMVSAT